MTTFRFLLRSLQHFWRNHLAVLLGVATGAAVICGAMLVGDSVRASLRDLSLKRLGGVDYALIGDRFFTEELAERLADEDGFGDVAPALSMEGSVTRAVQERVLRAGGISIVGGDNHLWSLLEMGSATPPQSGEIVLNRRVAQDLDVQVGDEVSLNLEVPSAIPRESLLGERNDLTRELPLTVVSILPDEAGAARFGLNPSQQIPSLAFVSLSDLQAVLDLAEVRRSRRNPVAKPARVNSLYVRGQGEGTTAAAVDRAARMTRALAGRLTLDDLGLKLSLVEERKYVSLESTRMILDDASVAAGREAAAASHAATSPVYVYLVNELVNANDAKQYAMYSVVAGLDFPTREPFGPFEFVAGRAPASSDEIVLNEFVADRQLKAGVGDEVDLKYFTVGSHGELPEQKQRFRVSGVVKLSGPAADRHLTPMLEGITDAENFSDWEQPFTMDLSRITGDDDQYWDEYRATPKAFLSLAAMQELFPSRYGTMTSLRVAVPDGQSMEAFARQFEDALLERVVPTSFGLVFQPVKYQGLEAAAGTTDFTGLFLGFSMFLILSAAILIGLLFRLGIDRRAGSIGLLEAVGFPPARVRRLFLAEGALIVLAGSAVGTLCGIAYAAAMIHGLRTWWVGAVGTRFLFLSVEPRSLAIGFASAFLIAAVSIWWGLRRLRAVTPRALLAGATEPEVMTKQDSRFRRLAAVVCSGSAFIIVAAGLLGVIPASEAFSGFNWQVVAFFVAGILLLTGALLFLLQWLSTNRTEALQSTSELGLRNAARQRRRSVATVGLIACATFVLVAVAASRRDPSAERPQKDSGNGGFLLVAESSVPLPFAIDSAAGRDELGMRVNGPAEESLLQAVNVVSLREREGDDASCLNLYQTGLPTILGVPEAMVDRGGFRFIGSRSQNPWTLLLEDLPDHKTGTEEVPVIPVLGDANSLMYSLKKGIGDVIAVPDEDHPQYFLQVVGMLDGSVFQGVLLMSEANLLRLYPDVEGYRYFLIEGPYESRSKLAGLLETQLAPYGFSTELVADRIADFLAVQNTYLSTFQTLGGLGLLLGTVGLGAVMLRNILERRGELALMRAIGFRNAQLAWLVFVECALLLLWGLVAGTVAALIAVSPHLMTRGADVPIVSGLTMLVAVVVTGLLSAIGAVWVAVRTPIIETLRGE